MALPKFSPILCEQNREKLIKHFKEGDVLLFKGNETTNRTNSDTEQLFRQESNFLYVCGVDEPGCYFCIEVRDSKCTSTLFLKDLDPLFPVWYGTIKSLENWTTEYGLTKTLYQGSMGEYFKNLKENGTLKNLFVLQKKIVEELDEKMQKIEEERIKKEEELNKDEKKKMEEVNKGVKKEIIFSDVVADTNPKTLETALFDSRAVKSPLEIEIISATCKLSCKAHIELMKKCKPGLTEGQLEAVFLYHTGFGGARHQAYIPIIGAGENSVVMHANRNKRELKSGEVVVIDCGCEHLGYASDITRTLPVNGKFTEEQKLIYSMVLAVQKKAISEVKPDLKFDDLQKQVSNHILEELIKAKFITCTLATAFEKALYRLFMPHGLGHLIGLDVHDVSIYPQTPLKTGMVITIEPGIYFNPFLLDKYSNQEDTKQLMNWDLIEKFRGLGIRIEDDILVTANGYKVLTELAPKEISDIEQLMAPSDFM